MNEGSIKQYDSESRKGTIIDAASDNEIAFSADDVLSSEDASKLVSGQKVWYEVEKDKSGERATDIMLRSKTKLVEDEGDGY